MRARVAGGDTRARDGLSDIPSFALAYQHALTLARSWILLMASRSPAPLLLGLARRSMGVSSHSRMLVPRTIVKPGARTWHSYSTSSVSDDDDATLESSRLYDANVHEPVVLARWQKEILRTRLREIATQRQTQLRALQQQQRRLPSEPHGHSIKLLCRACGKPNATIATRCTACTFPLLSYASHTARDWSVATDQKVALQARGCGGTAGEPVPCDRARQRCACVLVY